MEPPSELVLRLLLKFGQILDYIKSFLHTKRVEPRGGEGGGWYSHIVWVGVCRWVRENPALYSDQILQNLWPCTRPEMLNCSWFQSFVGDPVKRDPILDQFSMISRPHTRLNGLKTIPFPAAHTRIANIWEYPPPPAPHGVELQIGLFGE